MHAALANPRRCVHRVRVTTREEAEAIARLPGREGTAIEVVPAATLADVLPPGAVHQNLAIEADPLPHPEPTELARARAGAAALLALDRVTDPQNVGSILRSAAAFDAAGLVLPERGSAPETGALAKAASGALDLVPVARPSNLRQTLEALKREGFWCVGLAGDAALTIDRAELPDRAVLILGAEGSGLRRLTRETCDLLVSIPMTGGRMESLNVANAAAITLYEWHRQKRGAFREDAVRDGAVE